MERNLKDLKVVEISPEWAVSGALSIHAEATLRILPGRREVYRGRLHTPEREVVVKCYLPHAKQVRDWQREWGGLNALKARGLPAPDPLAVAEAADGTMCVLMQCIAGADALGHFLELADADGRLHAMQKLARLVSRLHEAGARQTDQHIDNWAIAGGALYLLDAGTYEFSETSLVDNGRLTDLAAICATLPPAAEGLFREALRSEYWIDATGPAREAILGGDLDRMIDQVQQARVRRYYKKTYRECSEFGERKGQWSGMFSKLGNAELVERFFQDPDALMAEGERLKSGNTCTVQRIRIAERTYVLKRYNLKSWWIRVRRSLSASRASRSWSSAWAFNLSFIPTARPVAFAEEAGFPRGRSYLLMEAIDGQLLPDYVEQYADCTELMQALVGQVGRIWDQLGRLRAVHGDLKATNWMVDASDQVILFDLDSTRFGLSTAVFSKGRSKDQRRFLENWQSLPALSEAFRQCMEAGREE